MSTTRTARRIRKSAAKMSRSRARMEGFSTKHPKNKFNPYIDYSMSPGGAAIATGSTMNASAIANTAADTMERLHDAEKQAIDSVSRKAKNTAAAARTSTRRFFKGFETRDLFAPKTWAFWRGVIMYFFMFSIVGHWMEIPYCHAMDGMFGIVDPTYAVWDDPWFVPYWVYGIGTVALTLFMLPLKNYLVKKRKSLVRAALEFFVVAVVLCAVLETAIGLVINQPDAMGIYPYWDNSVLPGNILGQGWIVNDIMLGLVALIYIWGLFPLCQRVMSLIGEKAADVTFASVCVFFSFACVVAYGVLQI